MIEKAGELMEKAMARPPVSEALARKNEKQAK